MALFITCDTLFHNQKYLLALVLKVKLTLPQPTALQPPPIKKVCAPSSNTHPKNAYS